MTKRFSFRLESVLDFRKDREKQAQRDLYSAQSEYAMKEHTIGQMKARKREMARVRSQEELRGIDVPRYQILRSFLRGIDHRLGRAHAELAKIGEKVASCVAALKGASVERKQLETLKAKRQEDYLDLIEKEDQKALDELILIRRGQAK